MKKNNELLSNLADKCFSVLIVIITLLSMLYICLLPTVPIMLAFINLKWLLLEIVTLPMFLFFVIFEFPYDEYNKKGGANNVKEKE